ncbi:MAG: hypothetical protein HC927_05865 [Deltaproteobacteria bacterium]|nr:hypothetical protein [Deltaproteobacteria bacterium]
MAQAMRIARTRSTLFVHACLLAGCAPEAEAPIRYTCLDRAVQERYAKPRPDYPLVWQTAHLDIYAKDDITVCAGTAAELERHVVFVANTLGLEPREHIPLYMSAGWPKEHCGSLAAGCSHYDGVNFSSTTAAYHELAHTVACELRVFQTPSLSEGLANLFEPRPSWLAGDSRDLAVALSADYGGEEWHPNLAMFFLRWVLETYGGDVLAELYLATPNQYSRRGPSTAPG